jgi:hypothetical protein
MPLHLIQALRELDPDLFKCLEREISQESIYALLKPLADTYAPSQTVPFTRARVLRELLEADGLLARPNVRLDTNFQNTGNSVLLLGMQETRKQVWLLAHLDIISYLIEPAVDGRYPLSPLCYHMMHPGSLPGVALGYDVDRQGYRVVCEGQILTDEVHQIFFLPNQPARLRPGQRVCFASQMEWDRATGELRGSIDDIAGVAALLVAARFLAKYDLELLLGLTDEEEGVSGESNQTICRGGARLLRFFEQPELVIATDIHESAPMVEGKGPSGFSPGDGASFAEKASHNRGEITPPHLYELMRRLAEELRPEGIRLTENLDGYLSRTEGVNAMLRTPNVVLMGFLGENRHFQVQETTANIKDLVDLARAVVCFALLTRTSAWQSVMHG